MNRIEHWTGYWPSDDSFMQNTMEPYYRLRQNPKKIRKGKRILNAWRMELLFGHPGYSVSEGERTYLKLAEYVDRQFFSEWKAVRMIEYAGSHNLTLVMVPDPKVAGLEDRHYEHPEYKEIRELLFRHLGIDPESSEARRCQYVGRYDGKYVYSRSFDENGYPIIGPMTCIFDEDSYEFLHVTQFIVEAKAARNP